MIQAPIVIKIKKICKRSVIYELDVPKALQKYFSKSTFSLVFEGNVNFEVSHNYSMLYVPAVALVFPLALMTSTPIIVKSIDHEFYMSLGELTKILNYMYRNLPSKFFLLSQITKNIKLMTGGALLFYSGGLDSTLLLYNHCQEKPYLVTVQGSDIPSRYLPIWHETMKLAIKVYKKQMSAGNIFIYFKNPLESIILSKDFHNVLHGNDWWGGIQAGVTLPTLVAPIIESINISKVYIASGIQSSLTFPWSDRREVYEAIKFGGTRVICDDYNLSRLDKARKLKEIWSLGTYPELPIRSCLRTSIIRKGNLNCGRCEKCIRTSLQLMIAGINPERVGFKSGPALHILTEFIGQVLAKGGFEGLEKLFWQEIIRELEKSATPFLQSLTKILSKLLETDTKMIKSNRVKTSNTSHLNSLYHLYCQIPLHVRDYLPAQFSKVVKLLSRFG